MIPWKDVLMWWIRKVQKHKKERMEERKRRDFYTLLMCSSLFRNGLRLQPLCNPPSGEPTCMGTSPTKNNNYSNGLYGTKSFVRFLFFSPCAGLHAT
jgi:hypothetical protein